MKTVQEINKEIRNSVWDGLTHEEKNQVLFERQKHTLDLFLGRHAISQEQHDKSLRDLAEKMGMTEEERSYAIGQLRIVC